MAIFQNGCYFTMSQKIKVVEPSLPSQYLSFLGYRFKKNYYCIWGRVNSKEHDVKKKIDGASTISTVRSIRAVLVAGIARQAQDEWPPVRGQGRQQVAHCEEERD